MQNPTPVIVPNAPVQPMPVPNEFDPEEAKRVKPLSTAAYFWLMFLFAVPLIGFIVCLIMAFAAKNENRKHFARSILIWILVGLIISGVIALVGAIFGQTLLQNLGVSDVSGIPDLLQQLFGGM